ncbi:hypothetical protein JDS98_07120 [Bacillus cereus group sp. N11]|uniref:hypothetical protein n=1 Tax=Bacillus cereus group sp. N11 TaxID=2794585 RepID=UPI0018F754B8|nr:hypothetical protein [Bacillus cereus group sp. N11]MBJ8097873.1 hypothetical protein [Bacillus cereus group sp. N11]
MEELYIHEVTVKRNQKVKQPAGNFKEEPVIIYERMKCRVTTHTAVDNERLKRNKQNFEPNFKIYTSAEHNIHTNDVIYFHDYVFEVRGEPRNSSFLNHHIELYCELLE